jgi:formylglycine-generating enzyme required for sulfatase activity
VGNYPAGASPYGAMDMAGNVWEWVGDWYQEDYYGVSPSDNPQGPVTGTDRVLRGGSWRSYVFYLRSAHRFVSKPDNRNSDYGFRCARSP